VNDLKVQGLWAAAASAILLRMTDWALPDALITRCAWCDRYEVGSQWLAKADVAAFLRDDGSTVTHGICADCVADLQMRRQSV
jgi:hypothetical protein